MNLSSVNFFKSRSGRRDYSRSVSSGCISV